MGPNTTSDDKTTTSVTAFKLGSSEHFHVFHNVTEGFCDVQHLLLTKIQLHASLFEQFIQVGLVTPHKNSSCTRLQTNMNKKINLIWS